MRRVLYLSAFLLVPALSAVAPLIAIPAITASAGSKGWEAYALGISIGALACVLVELGWPLTGPQRVAAEPPERRWETLVQSLRTRLLALVVVAPAVGLLAWAMSELTRTGHALTTLLMAVASAAAGLSCAWYFAGAGRPLRILATDAVPRALLTAVGALAVTAGAPIWVVPVAYLIAVAFGILASVVIARQERSGPVEFTLRDDLRSIRSQLSAMSGRSVSALYTALPVTLVAGFAPAALAAFTAADRLTRMALSILQALPNSMQNWVGSAVDATERRHRVGRSILLNAVVGLLAGVGSAVLLPPAADVLFSGTVHIDPLLAAASGLLMTLVCISRATGPLALVRYGRVHAVTLSATCAAAVGVPAICLLAVLGGAVGAMAGQIAAELTAIAIQSVALAAAVRGDRDR